MPYLPQRTSGYGPAVPVEEEVVVAPAPLVSHAENVPGPVMPASEYYGGAESAIPPPSNPYVENYDYFLASNPNLVETSYPSTGAPTTHRYIPPEGSTFPAVERDRTPPERPTAQELQQFYPRAFPDISPYWLGEGGRTAIPPPHPSQRYVPATTMNSMIYQYHSGEGAMGRGDPLDPRNTREDGRPLIQYRPGPDEPSSYHRYRRGWAGRRYLEEREARGGPPAPPPGYVPEVIGGHGGSMNTYWEERAPFPRVYSGEPLPPPPGTQGAGVAPSSTALSPGLLRLLAQMEQARQDRQRPPGLTGLFGGG